MMHLNYLSIGTAAVAVVVFAAVYYILLSRQRAGAWGTPPSAWMLPMELAKSVLLAAVVAGLVPLLGITASGHAPRAPCGSWSTTDSPAPTWSASEPSPSTQASSFTEAVSCATVVGCSAGVGGLALRHPRLAE
jgi:hypothetical protein